MWKYLSREYQPQEADKPELAMLSQFTIEI